MPGASTSARRRSRSACTSCRPLRRPFDADPGGPGGVEPVSAASDRSGVAGRSVIQAPVASWMAATTAGATTSMGSSPTPLAPCGAPLYGCSSRSEVMRGASMAVGMRYVASRSFW